MNLTKLSDYTLLSETKKLAAQEREILTQILHHLREVDSRRLYCVLKYNSIFDYAVGELKYSEGQAAGRVQAMRALVAVPEIESKIASGELSLSNVAMVQTAFVKSGKTMDRRAVLKRVENLSTREAEVIVGKPKKELTLDMIGDDALREKAKRVLGKYAHSKLSLEAVLHKLFDRELEVEARVKQSVKSPVTPAPELKKPSLHGIRKQLMRRGECSNCGSTYALQIDHIWPRAKGGTDHPSNLRVLCRACNQRSAIKHFGARGVQLNL